MNTLTIYSEDLNRKLPQSCRIRSLRRCEALNVNGKRCSNKKHISPNKVVASYCKRHIKCYKFDKPEECPICYQELDEKSPLSCGHYTHRECIYKWGKKMCPICKSQIKLTKYETKRFDEVNFAKKKMDLVDRLTLHISSILDPHIENATLIEINLISNYRPFIR